LASNDAEDARSQALVGEAYDVRVGLAISRSGELMANKESAALRRRIAELEREVELLGSDVLEVRAASRKPEPSVDFERPSVKAQMLEVRNLFAQIQQRRLDRPSLVTVVIPAYGKPEYTLRCLHSIATTWSESVNPSIVVVDDASPDGSVKMLVGIPGVDVVQNGANLGFLRSTNRGAEIARTPYICLLNNDTEVKDAWLEALVGTAEADERVGAVGSKLVYPNRKLQEAGGIIWSDAGGWNFGRDDDPDKSEYNFQRDVDYCSAASLLVRTELWQEIGGFDERFAPAYYEDVDLCFEVRAKGYRVVYQPRSEVVHYEGVSSGTDVTSGTKRYQEVNRPKFLEKWRHVLSSHLESNANNVERAVSGGAKTVLVIDSYVPMYDREAGSSRLYKIVQILRDLNYAVVFLPANGARIEPYSSALSRLGVEVLYHRPGGASLDELLKTALRRIDLAWICRPELCEHFIPIIRSGMSGSIVYDTIDLHFAREKRRAELEGGDDAEWRRLQALELSMAGAADLVVTVTEIEKRVLEDLGVRDIAVIPTIHDIEPHETFSFDLRSGIVFIGGYGHLPNVDAALWLCTEIMPRVWERLPQLRVTLLGNRPPPDVLGLRSDRVVVPGFIEDVGPFFEEARVFVAPLRYGAGIKGKVGQALSFGLPVVTTAIGADGYGLESGESGLLADSADAFADAVVRLHENRQLWARCSEGGKAVIEQFTSGAVRTDLQAIMTRCGA
jgi:GT2 family glycosyltransferase/glycosyltransferase involved in cell wall biosynthesis